MIVSFARRFLFVAVPKTATHAFRVALRPHLAETDWEQQGLFGKQAFPIDALARIGSGHITCREVRPFLIPGLWEQFFTFATVRNPYARFVSQVYFRYRDNAAFARDPLTTMKNAVAGASADRWMMPQASFLIGDDERLAVDYVARYESLQADFEVICGRIGVQACALPRVNEGHPPPFAECYDAELQEMVRTTYARDFDLFGYPAELESAAALAP